MIDSICSGSTSSSNASLNIIKPTQSSSSSSSSTNQTLNSHTSSASLSYLSTSDNLKESLDIETFSLNNIQINGDILKDYVDTDEIETEKNHLFNLNKINKTFESIECLSGTQKQLEKFKQNYDTEVEIIVEEAANIISNKKLGFGLYQFISFLIISIAWTIGNGWYAYVGVFTGYTPYHECIIDEINQTENSFFSYEKIDSCSYKNNFTNQVYDCKKWSYDTSQMKKTIISEYNFVCNKNYYFETAYSIEQIGYVIGTLLFSILADKIGRKPIFIFVLISMSILGFIQYFITNFFLYMALGLLINVSSSGLDSVSVPLVLEIFNTRKRTSFGIGMEYIWVLVLTSLALVAYAIKTWRELRLCIFIALALIGIISFWYVQESIGWLISTCRLDRARSSIERIAKFNRLAHLEKFREEKTVLYEKFSALEEYRALENKKHLSNEKNDLISDISEPSSIEERNALLSILKYPKFRLYVLIMALNWFATGLVYDGLTYMSTTIGDNVFVSWTLMNIIEFPAQVLCFFLLSIFGRRITTCVSLISCGVILTSTYFISLLFKNHTGVMLFLYIMAKFTSTQAYSSVIIHAPEIFPTHLRSFGYGICLFSGKLTSIISPMISLYLSKILSWLPGVIYGVISIICGCFCLYVPETLNRPLPNSIKDVIKWSRSLTTEEWKKVKQIQKYNLSFVKNLFLFKKRRGSMSTSLKSQRKTPNENVILINLIDSESA